MVRIITDSAADFEPQELEKYDITCVPMQISYDNNEYKENENLTKDQFYELLENCENFPKTSQPTPYDFEVLLEEFMENGDECIIITISSALSGTYQNAFLVKNMLDYENCYVLDSLNATAGQRLLVDYAVKLRDEGKSAKEIFEELEIMKTKIKLYACVDTLEYLHKGGRLSKTAYTVGTLANIKPVICISKEGKVEVSSKAMSMKGGISAVSKKLQTCIPNLKYPIYIVYSNNRKNGDLLAETVQKLGFEILPENIINIGATIGAHVGSGACGVVFVSDCHIEE